MLDEFHLLEKIEGLDAALAVGREKGLVAVVGIQNYGQSIDTYGETGADKLLDLFGIKNFGRQSPGASSDRIVKQLGQRNVSALVANRTPEEGGRRLHVEVREAIPTFSATKLASTPGVFANLAETLWPGLFLDWPFTIWRRRRPVFIPAPWLHQATDS